MHRLFAAGLIALALAAPQAVAARPVAAPAVTVVVACRANPETITITNTTKKAITLTNVGTAYQPRKGEPFRLGRSLAAGQRITFQAGRKAVANVLTRQFILEDNVGAKEAAYVNTSLGRFAGACR